MNRWLRLALATAGLVGCAVTASSALASPGRPDSAQGVRLDLSSRTSADVALHFDGLLPGSTGRRLFWVARNDLASVTPATLTVTFVRLRDVAGPCSTSQDKATAETASGIGGCRIAGAAITGTPRQGNLSRLVTVDLASGCSPDSATPLSPTGGPRTLHDLVGVPLALHDRGTGRPRALLPGQGVCIGVRLRWPPGSGRTGTPEHPLDNAAQGDSFAVDVRFDLTQTASGGLGVAGVSDGPRQEPASPLAITGVDVAGIAALAVLLLAAGVALAWWGRRRRSA